MDWSICDESLDEESDFCGISYITSEVRDVLRGLPEFSQVKEIERCLEGFHVHEFVDLPSLWQR